MSTLLTSYSIYILHGSGSSQGYTEMGAGVDSGQDDDDDDELLRFQTRASPPWESY
jgi:hypothetical protein